MIPAGAQYQRNGLYYKIVGGRHVFRWSPNYREWMKSTLLPDEIRRSATAPSRGKTNSR